MKKYLICTSFGEAFNAASKARRDAETIAQRAGYIPVIFTGGRTGDGSLRAAIRLAVSGIRNWRNLMRTVENGSLVLIQYPHYPLKSAHLMKWILPRAKKKKGLKFIALIHDLDSVRELHTNGAQYSDREVLPLFDAVICHNEKMKAYLADNGLEPERLIPLDFFDYLTEGAPDSSARKQEDGMAVAGNLSPEKSGYLTAWLKKESRRDGKEGELFPVHLYGKGMKEENLPKRVILHGAVPADQLPGRIRGGAGLVWDGPEAETCSGPSGSYLKLNNPHKASLYLAAGMPVFVWREAAIAGEILEAGAGLAVDTPAQAEEALRRLTAEEYGRMAENARRIGMEIREGKFLLRALERAEKRMGG